MIAITGDTHGDYSRFAPSGPVSSLLQEGDILIVCGDFGFIWDGSARENRDIDRIAGLPYTTVFISGNHENFDRLYRYPVQYWHGGRVRVIRPNLFLLMRGEFFYLEGHSFFCMGGAASHDISDGVLDEKDPLFWEKRRELDACQGMYRINHRSWWKEEMPLAAEYANAGANLEKQWWQTDYVITHCAPTSLLQELSSCRYPPNRLTDFLETVSQKLQFKRWFFGHYHVNRAIGPKFHALYEDVEQIEPYDGSRTFPAEAKESLLQQVRQCLAARDVSAEDAALWFLQKCAACPEAAARCLKAMAEEANGENENE